MIRDPIDIKNSNVWEKAGKPNQLNLNQDKKTIILLGDQKAGKTSFIKLIKGDFDLQTKPTRLIDFYTMKKQGVEIQAYEISSPKFEKALQFLIKTQNCSHLMIVLCVDLTHSENLVNRVNLQIENIRALCKEAIDLKSIDQINTYNEERAKQFHFIEKNEDVQIIRRMPFRFSLIGCKHDLFQKMKVEEKKWTCRCLRYLAHINEANLLFSSTKNMQTAAELRSVFIEEILGIRSKTYSNQKDHSKPLFILTGQDKIGDMSLPAFNNSGAFNQLKILEQQLESVFPSSKRIELASSQIKKEFNSIGLDSLISKNKKEIAALMRDKKIKMGMTWEPRVQQKTSTGFGFKLNKNVQTVNKLSQKSLLEGNYNKKTKNKEQEQYMDEDEQDDEDN